MCAEHKATGRTCVATPVALTSSLRLVGACTGEMRNAALNLHMEDQPFPLRMGVLEEKVWYKER